MSTTEPLLPYSSTRNVDGQSQSCGDASDALEQTDLPTGPGKHPGFDPLRIDINEVFVCTILTISLNPSIGFTRYSWKLLIGRLAKSMENQTTCRLIDQYLKSSTKHFVFLWIGYKNKKKGGKEKEYPEATNFKFDLLYYGSRNRKNGNVFWDKTRHPYVNLTSDKI
ncbi:hypothetical protein V1477_014877 [Vespula maculifrons]|uniref:Uncharacterized protein n=1 Tax=Vespula maculifrons TaxID=7453 RepID=A0ABD2BIP3_VESMC